MKLRMYSMRDHLAGFLTPTYEQNDAIAMRNFEMACSAARREPTLISWRPSDFSLWCLAEFDSDSGALSPYSPPVLVCNGDSFSGGKSDV